MNPILAGLLIAAFAPIAFCQTDADIRTYLRGQGQTPAEYVLSRAASHRITIRIWTAWEIFFRASSANRSF